MTAQNQPLPCRVLVVDDDHALSRTLVWVLSENGYLVSAIPSGDELFQRLEQEHYDLLLLDIALPGESGIELLKQLKADPRYRELPILMISSLSPEEAGVTALGLGAADFIAKPFGMRNLLARVKARLRAGMELNQARSAARTQTEMLRILQEITATLSPEEIFQVLVRRVAQGLRISKCSILLTNADAPFATVVAAYENPTLRDMRVDLGRYPEIRQALERGAPVLIASIESDPILAPARAEWEETGRGLPATSAIVVPFGLRNGQNGVFFLRTAGEDPALNVQDLEFANQVIRAAVASLEKAYDLQHAMQEQEQFRLLAETDPLTGLANRRALSQRLAIEVERALRYRKSIACLMVDVDHFKVTNDTYGHQVGDLILTQLAGLLRREQRAMDLVTRFGGEEFVMLLPETGPTGARTMANRLIQRVAAYQFGRPDLPVGITISVGIAVLPDTDVLDADSLLARADLNLLRAKQAGRNRAEG